MPHRPPDPARIQRRTVSLLFVTQIIGGVGVAIGIAVGALLAARMAGTGASGLAGSAGVVGGALLAIPATRLIRTHGRRPGLAFAYACGTLGALIVVTGVVIGSVPVLFAGMILFGGGTTANLQARYAAVDLARPDRRGQQLSLVVWATTIGAVSGPNLAPLADRYARARGLPLYAGPFAFSAAAFLVAALAIMVALRPDPLLTARRLEQVSSDLPPEVPSGVVSSGAVASDGVTAAPAADRAPDGHGDGAPGARADGVTGAPTGPEAASTSGLRAAARVVRANPSARLGIAAVAVGHVVMVGVMSMTPVHIGEYYHGDVLNIVGIVLSLHIAGMYALSPVVGWLTDRVGRRPVILGGLATLLTACAVAGTSGHRTPMLSVGLALLGLGWSATMVAGSTLLSESVGTVVRPAAQGLSDLVMGLAGALAGALSGLVVSWSGYPTLTLLAAIATVPLVALALRPRPAVLEGS